MIFQSGFIPKLTFLYVPANNFVDDWGVRGVTNFPSSQRLRYSSSKTGALVRERTLHDLVKEFQENDVSCGRINSLTLFVQLFMAESHTVQYKECAWQHKNPKSFYGTWPVKPLKSCGIDTMNRLANQRVLFPRPCWVDTKEGLDAALESPYTILLLSYYTHATSTTQACSSSE